ncbi:MAG: integrase catalytic subunit, partial [Halanaerobium sp.]
PLKPPYEACREKECRVNKYSFVTFEQNKYSVPDHLVGRFVNSRIYSDYIKIYYNDELVAKHQRIYEVHKCSIEIEHYLLTLKRKPGALKNSLAFHQMAPDLKEIYELYYDNYTRKTKEFIELLELVSEKGLDEIKGAIETLSKNKKSMVTTANIKVLVQKENTPDFTISSEINENSLELLKKWDTMFSLQNHQEVLRDLFRDAYDMRKENGRKNRIKNAKFPYKKYLDTLIVDYLPESAQAKFKELKSLKFIEENRNIIFSGNPGTGKTHLSIGLGIKACNEGYKVFFATVPQFINQLKETQSERRLTNFESKFQKYDLIILDELGYISFDQKGSELLFN